MTCAHPHHVLGGRSRTRTPSISETAYITRLGFESGLSSPYTPCMGDATDGGKKAPHTLSVETRTPAKLGVAVVQGLVDVIVSGELSPGDSLPPELPLSQQFGVSRT